MDNQPKKIGRPKNAESSAKISTKAKAKSNIKVLHPNQKDIENEIIWALANGSSYIQLQSKYNVTAEYINNVTKSPEGRKKFAEAKAELDKIEENWSADRAIETYLKLAINPDRGVDAAGVQAVKLLMIKRETDNQLKQLEQRKAESENFDAEQVINELLKLPKEIKLAIIDKLKQTL